ncbi:sensor domain-containing diguanylate cyclase [Proteinivorax hydrogeniformans]|uniref:Sensor domain-containing diguanylate cyclase n=1 Tax=Proteinivorax hydrogeniformans TaxID=1826727 RepID=A0AAU8HT93_9FIRM
MNRNEDSIITEELAGVGSWEFDHSKGSSKVSNQVLSFLGLKNYERNDIRNIITTYFSSQKDQIIHRLLNKQAKGKSDWYEGRYNHLGQVKWLGLRFEYDFKKDVTHGIIQDFTPFKLRKEKLAQSLKIKDAMLEISHAIVEIEKADELFDFILNKITAAINKSDLASVLVLDENNELRISASKGYSKGQVDKFKIKLEDAFIYQKTGGRIHKTVIINNLKEDLPTQYHTILDNDMDIIPRSSMCGPIFVDNKLYGFVSIECEENDIFDEVDWNLMEYVRKQVAIAINKRQLHEKTLYLSRYDDLTGVYNRRYFETLINEKIDNENKFYLVIFDLNRLKDINDTFGHLAGDSLIKNFANILKQALKQDEYVARLGGDEFVAVFSNCGKGQLKERLELIKKKVENPIDVNGISINTSFCYGIATFPDEAIDYNKLVGISDTKMYKSKDELYNKHRREEG